MRQGPMNEIPESLLKANRETLWQMSKEIAELKALCTRAADALEKYTNYPLGMVMSATLRESGKAMVSELRKAAQ